MRPIRYEVRFPAPASHYAEVEAVVPADGAHEVEVFLPVWTPGSYLVREYSRHLEGMEGVDDTGRSLSVEKVRKNRWRLAGTHPLNEIHIRYRLYCHELSVRTNYLDDTFALLNGAASFVFPANCLHSTCEVTLQLPEGWAGSWSGMAAGGTRFHASAYDTLVDSPIVAGSPSVRQFEVEGRSHLLLNFGDTSAWDETQAVSDVGKLVRTHLAMWGALPYERYLFINLLTGGNGGLEHANSTVLISDRLAMRTRPSYLSWLNLVSHEFFHVWNVKRLRPRELGPFDYENEVYTPSLWIAEGFTEYYGILATHRAGMSSDEEFLTAGRDSISGLVERLQTTPGRLYQPVSLASRDAWIKLYRPDENSINCSISYYIKGAVIAWLLDAKIRRATDAARKLDDGMRLAYSRHSGASGFSSDEFLAAIQEVAGVDLTQWMHRAVNTTEELDYNEALAWFGLRFKAPAASKDTPPKAWTGVSTKSEAGRLTVTEVRRGTPASDAGVSAGDEILAINNYRLRPEQWDERMTQYRAGETIQLLVARNDRLVTVPVALAEEPARRWVVEIDPEATGTQKEHFRNW